jgi:hypothetical protein
MPFKALVYFLLSMIKESAQNALERFFWKTGEVIRMTEQAFSEARQKIRWEALRELFEATVTSRHEEEIQRWDGRRLLAIDGSKINLPNDPQLREYFGTIGAGNSSPCAQGSILYDRENDVIADALIEPMAKDERTLAAEHIKRLAGTPSFGRELILFDRGRPSMELIELLMREKFDLEIDGLGLGDHEAALEKGGRGPVKVRVIKLRLSGGERETLISSLEGSRRRVKRFKALYFKRWPIETKYDEVKKKLEAENFSGILVDNIRQDFYAAMTLGNIAGNYMKHRKRG